MGEILLYRHCKSCDQRMPESEFNGSTEVCKYCNKERTKQIKKHTMRVARQADQMMLNAMKQLVQDRDLTIDDDGLPNIGSLVEKIVGAFGGRTGIALQYAANYLASPPGSPTRQRILSDVQKGVMKASELGYAKKPLALLTDEELEGYIKERHRRLFKIVSDAEEGDQAEVA